MKIVENTPDRLVLSDSTLGQNLLGGAVAVFLTIASVAAIGAHPVKATGTFLIVVALFIALYVLSERVRVVFNRQTGLVSINRRSVRNGASHVTYRISEVSWAEIVSVSPGMPDMVNLELVIDDGPHAGRHPLNRAPQDRDRYAKPLAAILDWLRVSGH